MTKIPAIVVGLSGGVSSAVCAGWALANFPPEWVTFLWHDTKEEDPDTYRFIRDLVQFLGHPLTERSDGRSVTQLCRDEGAIASNQMAFCSRILKAAQRDKFFAEIRREREITLILGYSRNEPRRIQNALGRATQGDYQVRFPLVELGVSKQIAADWLLAAGLRLPAMYCWAEHANCVGCFRGGKAYWLAVAEHAPEVFEARAVLEEHYGHTIISDVSLRDLVQIGLRRRVNPREKIEIGSCECGD